MARIQETLLSVQTNVLKNDFDLDGVMLRDLSSCIRGEVW